MDIYEICDTTGEVYFSLGLFRTVAHAKREIKKYIVSGEQMTENPDGFEQVEIYKRKLGWCDIGKSVYRINREEILLEEEDEIVWRTVEVWPVKNFTGKRYENGTSLSL